MKKLLAGMALVTILSVAASAENFDMGTIEVHDIKVGISADAFREKNRDLIDKAGKEENLMLRETTVSEDREKKSSIAGEISDSSEKVSYMKALIGDDSRNDIEINYSEKTMNYLWNGNLTLNTADVPKVDGKKKINSLAVDYDDVWNKLSFSTHSRIMNREEDIAGSDLTLLNFYNIDEDIYDLQGNAYYSEVRDWNFSGRIAGFEKKITPKNFAGTNGTYKNDIFQVSGFRQFDLSREMFVDSSVTVRMDSLDYGGNTWDNNRYDAVFDFTSVRKNFNLVTKFGIYSSDSENETGLSVKYSKFSDNNTSLSVEAGRRYKPVYYEDLFFTKDVVTALAVNADIFGEATDFLEVVYTFVLNDVDIAASAGSETVNNKYYFMDTVANNAAYAIGRYNEIDRNYFSLSGKRNFYDGSKLELSVMISSWEEEVPYEAETMWSAKYAKDLTQTISTGLSGVYTGKYMNFPAGGTENDGWLRVDLEVSQEITDRLDIEVKIENLLDKDYSVKPGFSENERKVLVGARYNF